MQRALLLMVLVAAASLAGCVSGDPVAEGPSTTTTSSTSSTGPSPSPTPTPMETPAPSPEPSSPAPSVPPPNGSDDPPGTTSRTPEWGTLESALLRPGVRSDADGSLCTFDFLFFDPVAGDYFVGLAAHCTDTEEQEVRLADGGTVVGRVAFDSDLPEHQGTGVDVEDLDFSLVRLEPGMNLKAHPQMMGHAGPTGFVRQGEPSIGDLTAVHGHGLLLGDTGATRSRQGALMFMDDHWGADMPTIFGDSGGPVLHVETGKALGIVSGLRCCGDMPPSTSYGPTLEWILEQLPLAGFPHVELALADGTTTGLDPPSDT